MDCNLLTDSSCVSCLFLCNNAVIALRNKRFVFFIVYNRLLCETIVKHYGYLILSNLGTLRGHLKKKDLQHPSPHLHSWAHFPTPPQVLAVWLLSGKISWSQEGIKHLLFKGWIGGQHAQVWEADSHTVSKQNKIIKEQTYISMDMISEHFYCTDWQYSFYINNPEITQCSGSIKL